MKKYLFILISVSCFGQFNPVQWYEFGANKAVGYNTFIGGVGSVINTKALLAAKLSNYPSGTAFSVNSIRNFEVVGNDVRCYILNPASINIGRNSFVSLFYTKNSKVKKLNDVAFAESLEKARFESEDIIEIGNSCFSYGYATHFIFKNCISIGYRGFWDMYGGSSGTQSPQVIYLPISTNIGVNQQQEDVFTLSRINSQTKIYLNPTLQTSNSGTEEGDIAYARSLGAEIIYVANFTPPNPMTDLSAGIITSTSIQVNFTAPTGSTNAIDFYEVWLNGFPHQEISGSGQTITGLTAGTSYEVEVKPVDIYYNKSSSNKINVSTL